MMIKTNKNDLAKKIDIKIRKISEEISDEGMGTLNGAQINRWLTFFITADQCIKGIDGEVIINRLFELYEGLMKKNPSDLSFLSGRAGMVYNLVRNYERTGEANILNRATELVLKKQDDFLESEYVQDSFFLGRAGVLFTILLLYEKTKNKDVLSLIDLYSRKIVSNAFPFNEGLVWYNPHQLVLKPLCSFGYGVAGIAYVFYALGNFFDNAVFRTVYKKALNYLDANKDEATDVWFDNRGDVKDEATFLKYIDQYHSSQGAFFKEQQVDYTIAHGVAGILFFYNQTSGIDNPVLLHKKESELYGLEIQLSECLGEASSFLLPKINFQPNGELFVDHFIDDQTFQNIIIDKKYPKLKSQLNKLDYDVTDLFNKGDNFLEKETLSESVKILPLDDVKKKVLVDLVRYEEELWNRKMNKMYRLKDYIGSFVCTKERIDELNISNDTLLTRCLEISNKVEFKKYYIFKESDLSVNKQVKVETFWKVSKEAGIEELRLGFLKVIIDLFKNGKRVETALMEMMLFCFFQRESKLSPLITFSSSKNKKDLLDRLPFLFLYQIRLLIADGILSFSDQTSSRFKFAGLKFILSLFGVHVKK